MQLHGVLQKDVLLTVPVEPREHHASWLRRVVVAPVLRMLRRGATPKRVAWSLATGFVIGINPIIGSTTIITLAVAHLLKLKHSASQIGAHSAYPFQIALLLPFLQAGTLLFRADPLPLQASEILSSLRQHPMRVARFLWTWEWHALVVWCALAAVLIPLLAVVLRRVLERLLHRSAPGTAAHDVSH